MKKILFVFGTRPEAIKMAPLIKEFKANPDRFNIKVCVSGQHKEMLYQVLDFFDIRPDYDLDIMEPGQSLFGITSKIISRIEPILEEESPDLVFVQGDTSTVFLGALGAFYKMIPVAHLEAGLRTGDIYSPFPEELNRVMVSKIASYHFAPTDQSVKNLINEGVKRDTVYNVGNTVIDALHLAVSLVNENEGKYRQFFENIDFDKRIILVTSHRRESIGAGFDSICRAIRDIAIRNDDIEVVFPIHYSPAIREAAKKNGLYDVKNIHVIDPLDYPVLVYVMSKSFFVLTDSGGIQEEAPSLGKPVLVMRETTERPEGIESGVAELVGTKYEDILASANRLLDSKEEYTKMANAVNPYGDGKTSKKIADIIWNRLESEG
mgnify:CR=1 FL=1